MLVSEDFFFFFKSLSKWIPDTNIDTDGSLEKSQTKLVNFQCV